MRLSEARLTFIAQQISRDLLDTKLVAFDGTPIVMESEIAKIIQQDLQMEEEIDREVVDMIAGMKKVIPQGSAEWNALYFQKKEEAARRRNFVL